MKFLEFIESDWIARKTHELVSIKSETLSESEICEFYASELESLGLVVERRPVSNGRFNIYGKLQGVKSQQSLIFNGHLDTIPIGEAWPPRISQDKIFGRGAEDMKGEWRRFLPCFALSNSHKQNFMVTYGLQPW